MDLPRETESTGRVPHDPLHRARSAADLRCEGPFHRRHRRSAGRPGTQFAARPVVSDPDAEAGAAGSRPRADAGDFGLVRPDQRARTGHRPRSEPSRAHPCPEGRAGSAGDRRQPAEGRARERCGVRHRAPRAALTPPRHGCEPRRRGRGPAHVAGVARQAPGPRHCEHLPVPGHPLGVHQSDRARSGTARPVEDLVRTTGTPASGRPGRHPRRAQQRRTAVGHRIPR